MRRRGRARGGQGGAEPRARVRQRELHVLELSMEGLSQHQIAERLGITQPAVSKILQRLEDRLLADLATTVERQRAQHTFRLEHVFREAMRAWKESQQDGVRKRQRKTDGGAAGTTIAEIVSEPRHGDARYLTEARNALSDLRSMWGLNAPTTVAVNASPFADWSDAALDAEIGRQTQLLQLPTAHLVDNDQPTSKESDHAKKNTDQK